MTVAKNLHKKSYSRFKSHFRPFFVTRFWHENNRYDSRLQSNNVGKHLLWWRILFFFWIMVLNFAGGVIGAGGPLSILCNALMTPSAKFNTIIQKTKKIRHQSWSCLTFLDFNCYSYSLLFSRTLKLSIFHCYSYSLLFSRTLRLSIFHCYSYSLLFSRT